MMNDCGSFVVKFYSSRSVPFDERNDKPPFTDMSKSFNWYLKCGYHTYNQRIINGASFICNVQLKKVALPCISYSS